MPDKLSPDREAEIDRWIAEFRTGVIFTDSYTKVKWEFVSDLPNGGMTIRKIGTTGQRTKHEWYNDKVRSEFGLLIRSHLRLETMGLILAAGRFNQLKDAIKTFIDHGTIDPIAPLVREEDPSSLIYGIENGVAEALSAWIEARPHNTALREILNRMAGTADT